MAIETLYPAIRPSLNLDFANAKALDPRITFSRASAATYYDGKTVAKAEENLLVWSQDFDSTVWPKTNASVAANVAIAPDGTNTADLLTASSDTFCGIGQGSSYPQGQTVLSIYAKAATSSIIRLGVLATGSFAWFDLTTGVAGTVQSGALAAIQSVGNGWFRCVLIVTGAPQPVIRLANADNSVNATTGNSVYIWGAQLEQRSQVTAYTPTTTQSITNYVPVLQTAAANVARFDHNPVTGESLGLLVEEQRTNLLTYSEQLGNVSAWVLDGTTITTDTIVAPDGTISADIMTTTGGNRRTYRTVTKDASVITYTFSTYAKAYGYGTLRLYFDSGSSANRIEVTFNVSTGTISSVASAYGTFTNAGASIVSAGNGWYRCTLTGTSDTSTSVRPHFQLIDVSSPSGVYIWGAQLEAGSFPTSYIKTEASQVTRAADYAAMTGANFSSWYRPDEGTIFSEFQQAANTPALSQRVLQIGSVGTASGHLIFRSSTAYAAGTYESGAYQGQISLTSAGTEYSKNKVAYSYKTDQFSSAGNGGAVTSDASGHLPYSVNMLSIGSAPGPSNTLNGHVRRITYYPKALPGNLQALTA